MEPMHTVNLRTAARVLAFLNPRRLYHRAEIEFADRIPVSDGAAMLTE
jgi:hypothetical protein